jgi:hypothetical protein
MANAVRPVPSLTGLVEEGVLVFAVLPSPSMPAGVPPKLWPQQVTFPLVRIAQVKDCPAAMALAVMPAPRFTGVGLFLCTLSPTPNCPNEFPPQQRMLALVDMSTHVWLIPHTIAETFFPSK